VHGWDDPRMPTLRGMRRRGYPAAAIRKFIDEIGVSKVNSLVDVEFLHFHVREASEQRCRPKDGRSESSEADRHKLA
jgi:glutaminyl-tRNA synthetase